jgi:chemotaxis protein MotC
VRWRLAIPVWTAALLAMLQNGFADSAGQVQLRNSIRTLESMQDATAVGDHVAADLQSKLVIQIEADLNNAKPGDLQDERNLKAIAVYLFSGGSPDVAERRLTSLRIDPEIKTLLDGALAYARGDKASANKFLREIDPADLPPNLGGRVALVKAILISNEDMATALKSLSAARILMPGTLVEEAALRRCISFAGKLPDIEHLEHCASQYIRRFPKSVYWQEFEDSFIMGLIEVDYAVSGGTLLALNTILDDLSAADHRRLLLAISKASIGRGKFKLTMECAAKALEIPQADRSEMARSDLYLGAVMIVQKEFEAGKAKLEAIDKSLLDQSDKALFDKALELTIQIVRRPDMDRHEVLQSPMPDEPDTQISEAYTSLLARAETALADANPIQKSQE